MKIAVMSDTHCPYEDPKSVDLFIKVLKSWKPDVLVHIGDLVDFYSLSSFSKNPDKQTSFLTELEKVWALMDRLDGLAPRKVFTEGNHCNRLQRYLFDRAPELYGYLDVPKALQLKERGWEYYPYQEVATIGGVGFVHDLGYAGVNATRQTVQAYPDNIVFGHSHRFASYTAGNLKRDTYTAWNVGWLGDPRQIDYLPSVKVKQDWTHGFLLITIDGGIPFFQPCKINRGKTMVDGKIYS